MAKFHHSYEVCTCKHVSLAEIKHAIIEKKADTLEKIGVITDAGTCCKCCRDSSSDIGAEKMELYLTQILNKFKKEI